MSLVKEILQKLDLGSSVAEFDAALETYFVETQTFRKLLQNDADIVAGDKGTGKTALFRILQARAAQYAELKNVVILPAFNPSGNPIFQRLTESDPLDEPAYGSVWKTYILALVGNWLLDQEAATGGDSRNRDHQIIERVLTVAELRSLEHTPVSVFERIVEWAGKKIASTKSVGVSVGIPKGPSVTPKLEFEADATAATRIRFEEALAILDRALAARNQVCWVTLDRLDEAFQGVPAVEIPALRALFRVFLDLMPFEHVRLKLFVRRDLFRKLTQGGFVNLTHVNARKIEITWDEDDLKNLLSQRVRENREFLAAIGLSKESTNDQIFDAMFPRQVDPGGGRPDSWAWMMSRIRDGNGLKPPRNLIDLVKKAQESQTRREERDSNSYEPGTPMIGSDALKRGLESLSAERVNDTLLAEVGEYAKWIEKFRDGKAEHNEDSLAATLGMPPDATRKAAKVLTEIGFLEQVGDNYKIPMLYRDGLNVTQGKAF
jgi:hypothetical protein